MLANVLFTRSCGDVAGVEDSLDNVVFVVVVECLVVPFFMGKSKYAGIWNVFQLPGMVQSK